MDVQLKDDPVCNYAGCTQYLWKADDKEDKHPMDYPVPSFGVDRDVVSTFNSLDIAENMRRHRWNVDMDNLPKKEDPTEYNTKPELDSDIIDTQAHEKLAESKFMVTPAKKAAAPAKKPAVAVFLQSDPICDSSGCNQYKFPEQAKKDEHPVDYPVPNFGRDGDVIGTYNSLDVAENLRKHKWNLSEEDLKKKDDDPVQYNGDPSLDDDIVNT